MRAVWIFALALLAVPTAQASEARHIDGDGQFGCYSQSLNDKLTKLVVAGDAAAFGKLLRQSYAAGECVKFTDGEKVTIQDQAFWSGIVCVARPGQPRCLWTDASAVTR